MPLHTLETLLHDPHLQAVDFFRRVEHPSEGVMIQMPPLGRWSDSVPDAPTPAPRLGEHNDLLKDAAAKAWSKTWIP